MIRSPFQLTWDLTIHSHVRPCVIADTPSGVQPLQDLASSLVHYPVSGSDTICNRSSPPLAVIVLFRLFFLSFPSKFCFKTRLLRRSLHTLIKNVLFPYPIDVGSHNPPPFRTQSSLAYRPVSTPFRTQRPCWPIARCLALIPFVTVQAHH